MRLHEIKRAKSKTVDQQRIANLKATADRAQQAAKIEQQRQKMAKAQQAITRLRQATTAR